MTEKAGISRVLASEEAISGKANAFSTTTARSSGLSPQQALSHNIRSGPTVPIAPPATSPRAAPHPNEVKPTSYVNIFQFVLESGI
ncbi:hypothetical protein RUM43_000453 [Polyplax serrata]|uniref:Uncharacterized protein n=1 Tax=Polyplax serrata TaxID=468196 RepID=A0AAN8XQF4_POLSC